jgi:hypothetical protein
LYLHQIPGNANSGRGSEPLSENQCHVVLETGSILFFAAAFPTRRTIAQPLQPAIDTIAQPLQHCTRVFTKEEAQQDLKRLRQAGFGRYLAARWGRDPATVSSGLAEWADGGAILRERQGKSKRAFAVIGN